MSSQLTLNRDQLSKKIGHCLLHDWDPIGVSRIPEAADEYDSYVPAIQHLLTTGASVQQVFEYLWSVETVNMCLSGNRAATEAIAERLTEMQNLVEEKG